MKYLPIGLDVKGRICIVVGAGIVGTRKVGNLLKAGATVRVVAPEGTTRIEELAASGEILWSRRTPSAEDLADAFLLVAATDDRVVNEWVVQEAERRGVLFCDASDAGRTQVIFGALHEGSGVTLAVFTDGEDPKRSRQTRDRIADLQDRWGKDE